MINLSLFFHDKPPSKGNMSITAKLEAYIGNYFVSGEGSGVYEEVLTVYYDGSINNYYDAVDRIEKNVVAYLSSDYKYAFVLVSMLEKFKEDTKEYGITYIPVKSFEAEDLCLDNTDNLPRFMTGVRWINDDFLNDETIAFDFEAFKMIDSGLEYLNPKHFSVKELLYAIRKRRYAE